MGQETERGNTIVRNYIIEERLEEMGNRMEELITFGGECERGLMPQDQAAVRLEKFIKDFERDLFFCQNPQESPFLLTVLSQDEWDYNKEQLEETVEFLKDQLHNLVSDIE
jgi:hypothetical protein